MLACWALGKHTPCQPPLRLHVCRPAAALQTQLPLQQQPQQQQQQQQRQQARGDAGAADEAEDADQFDALMAMLKFGE